MLSLSKQGKASLNGPSLTLSNLEVETGKLPEQDRHLLIPPASIENADLYDIAFLIKLGRSNGQEIFSKLVLTYFELDRELRVSAHEIKCNFIR